MTIKKKHEPTHLADKAKHKTTPIKSIESIYELIIEPLIIITVSAICVLLLCLLISEITNFRQ